MRIRTAIACVLGLVLTALPALPAHATEPTGEVQYLLIPTGDHLCLDDPHFNDLRVILWPCHGGANQKWEFDRQPSGWLADEIGTFRISGKCLDAYGNGTTHGTPVILWDCHGGANQRWVHYMPWSSGAFHIGLAGVPDACVVSEDGTDNPSPGTQLVLGPCTGTNGAWVVDIPRY